VLNDRPLLLVDGDNLAHRAYHSTPKTVVSPPGVPINAIVGFFGMLANIWQKERPGAIFVAWDTLGVQTYRDELWPSYQGGRVFDEAICMQLNMLEQACRHFQFGVAKMGGYEADDLIASAVKLATASGRACLIYSTDKDNYQLVSEAVTVISPVRGGREPERITPLEVVQKFGVLPDQVPAFKALSGDSSDKIPGIKGIGPKGAADLLLRHGSLENVISSWPEELQKRALLFLKVVTMRTDAPVDLPTEGPNWEAGSVAVRELGAERLATRLGELHKIEDTVLP
jgi:DNA polymerase-1